MHRRGHGDVNTLRQAAKLSNECLVCRVRFASVRSCQDHLARQIGLRFCSSRTRGCSYLMPRILPSLPLPCPFQCVDEGQRLLRFNDFEAYRQTMAVILHYFADNTFLIISPHIQTPCIIPQIVLLSLLSARQYFLLLDRR